MHYKSRDQLVKHFAATSLMPIMWYLDVESELLSVTSIKIKAQHWGFFFVEVWRFSAKELIEVSSWNHWASYHWFPRYLQWDQEPMKALCLFLSTQSHYSSEQTSSNCVSLQFHLPLSTQRFTNGIKPAAATPETKRLGELKACTESQNPAFIWLFSIIINFCGRKGTKGTHEFS